MNRHSSSVVLVVALCVSVTQATNSSDAADTDKEFDADTVQQLISDIDHVVACQRLPGTQRRCTRCRIAM